MTFINGFIAGFALTNIGWLVFVWTLNRRAAVNDIETDNTERG